MESKNKIRFWKEVMGSLNKNLHRYLKIKLKDIELKKEEVHFLHIVCKEKEVQQNELTKIFHVNKSTTTRKIKKLINYSYVKREKNPNDHRQYILSPTQKGLDLSNYVKEIFKDWNMELTRNLTNEEMEKFREISQKIIKNSDEFIERIYEHECK